MNEQLNLRNTKLTQITTILRPMQGGQEGSELKENDDTVGPGSYILLSNGRSSSWPGCGCACRCATTGAETVVVPQFSSKVVDFPFVPQRQLPMVPLFRKTIEIRQLCISCLTCPSLCNDRLGMAQIVQKTCWKYRRCSTFAVVDVAVISQRQSRLCREVPQTRSSTGCSSAEEGDFAAVLQHFSASVHLDVEAQGGGDAVSLTLGRSATPIRCNYWRVSTKTCVKSSVRTTTYHNVPQRTTTYHNVPQHTTTTTTTTLSAVARSKLTLFLRALHSWQFAAFFEPSMMKSFSSSRAPRKSVLGPIVSPVSCVIIHSHQAASRTTTTKKRTTNNEQIKNNKQQITNNKQQTTNNKTTRTQRRNIIKTTTHTTEEQQEDTPQNENNNTTHTHTK